MMLKPHKKIKNIAPVRLITVSFFVIIVIGTLLLCLPIASKNGRVSFLDALFVSTSATCVTGLTPFDTYSQWTGLGQAVILVLIQLGGLGLLTFTTGFSLLLRGKIGLRDLQIAKEHTSASVMDVPHLIKTILLVTLLCESAGAALLAIRFVPQFGPQGVWISVFLSVSSYCNAGFDILGFLTPNSSLAQYYGDPLVIITISLLIVAGGLGFIVISELYAHTKERIKGEKRAFMNNSLHTKVVVFMSAVLIVIGTVLLLLFEYDHLFAGMNFGEKLSAAFFQSVSARTAGYASVDIASEQPITQCATIILMFIGASPASTGGGIKTTTFLVLIATVFSVFRGRDETTIFRRRVDKSVVYRSLAITVAAFLLVLLITGVIIFAESGNPRVTPLSAMFEAVSAFGTVGLSANLTPYLSGVSKIAIIITMFIGRIGPVSMGLVFSMRSGRKNNAILPEGRIIVG